MATDILKRCSKCKLELAASLFSPDRRAKDGLQPRCRVCANEAKKAAYRADPEKARTLRNAYYASNKERVLSTNTRSRAKHAESVRRVNKAWYERVKQNPEWIAKRDAKTAATKVWKQAYDRAHRAKNPELHLSRAKAWRLRNPEARRLIVFTYDAKRRAKEKAGDRPAVIRKWLGTQKRLCHWCGTKCAKDFHIDHIQPLARGGLHVVANLCVACPRCNLKKNARDPIEFAQSLGLLL